MGAKTLTGESVFSGGGLNKESPRAGGTRGKKGVLPNWKTGSFGGTPNTSIGWKGLGTGIAGRPKVKLF